MAEQEQIHAVENYADIQTMSSEDAAKAWAVQHRINEDAVEKLFEEGFNSLDAIKLIEPDDLPKSKISKGQRKLIIASVEKLNNALAGQTGDTAHCSSASSVQQHNNVQIEANEQNSEQTVITPNQMVTRNSQLPNQTAYVFFTIIHRNKDDYVRHKTTVKPVSRGSRGTLEKWSLNTGGLLSLVTKSISNISGKCTILLCKIVMNIKSFSYQDTPSLRSFLVCILNFDNKTSKTFSDVTIYLEDIWEKHILYINQGP